MTEVELKGWAGTTDYSHGKNNKIDPYKDPTKIISRQTKGPKYKTQFFKNILVYKIILWPREVFFF